jgi:hypothetical protein
MSTLDLNAVMDAVGVRLLTIAGLRVYDFAADQVAVPAGIVGLPETIEYDSTFARGSDRVVIPVHLMVSKVSDRAGRDVLGPYIAGSGSKSVKATLDGTLGGTVQTARVMSTTPQTFRVSDVDYLGATFRVECYS